MKVLLYRDGAAGVAAKLPGDEPMEELAELLGGAAEMTPLNERLMLVTQAGAGCEGKPIWYALHRVGREAEPISGECAVVGIGVEGRLRDISVQDIQAAECYVRRAGA